ncbi:MAG: signal peptidase II [Ilumatobacteraceae bacterium]
MPTPRRLASIALVLVIIDQLSKTWAVSTLTDGHVINIVGSLRFALGFNSGFAFSQGQSLGPFIGIVALVAIALLVRAMLRAHSALAAYGLSGIVAGAIGNVSDRLFRESGFLHGRVVDFIDLQWFPVFNVADSAISVGACLLIIAMVRESRDHPEQEVSIES